MQGLIQKKVNKNCMEKLASFFFLFLIFLFEIPTGKLTECKKYQEKKEKGSMITKTQR